MDRSRFVPAPEGLEGRTLMSTGVFSAARNGPSNSAQFVPYTYRQKEARIQHLPYYLDQLQTGRFLPKETIELLQNDLQPLVGKLKPVPTNVLNQYNHFLRGIFPKVSLSVGDAHGLNHAFSSVLTHANAPSQTVANLTADMTALAQVDANSPNSLYLATNDYSLVLESALGVGHPLKIPEPPILAARDRVGGSTSGATHNPQPTLVGLYRPGGIVDPGTMIQIIDANSGAVLGTAPVLTQKLSAPSDGKFAVTVQSPLSPGKYIVRSQAFVNGIYSEPSRAFVLKVVAPHGEAAAKTTTSSPTSLAVSG